MRLLKACKSFKLSRYGSYESSRFITTVFMYKNIVIENNTSNERMMKMKLKRLLVLFFIFLLIFPAPVAAKEGDELSIPDYVLSISKENTYPNETEDEAIVEPSFFTKSMLESSDLPIENPDLIKLLNESNIRPTPFSIGYRGEVYLGRWPLNYESKETTINWLYQKINEGQLNNVGSDSAQSFVYEQQEEREVKGALTSKIANPSDVRRMILLKAQAKTNLPLAYTTVIGKGTRAENSYSVPAQKQGVLSVYAPAVNEKGQITFGEVYIELKGSKKQLTIKNVTKQGIGAWIPIQDYASFSFQIK